MLASDRLTAHFSAGVLNAHNAPSTLHANLRTLAVYLEAIRAELGVPLRITSGYRSPSYNAALPGASPTSDHVNGLAADFQPLGMNASTAWLRLRKARDAGRLPTFDQFIYYPLQHLHVGIGPRSRGQFLVRIAENRYATVAPASSASGAGPVVSSLADSGLSLAAALALLFAVVVVVFGLSTA